ncbi:hypothetical protein HOU72_gp44 [Pectobacterium phage Khlen]|uniref:Uncharacterized protein n=2 Tax=Phimunavirus khlen TaxID=2733340 RepID=A0A385IGY4_9CAUD|nr:hypothetical protein HOU72_gp44 [Pectobacterium phage Khlen]AXY82044.1 hypothetical protein [Pectobacterium phage Slant]AZF94575.1 hypothetical protein [Pectobacterium phage Khlen]
MQVQTTFKLIAPKSIRAQLTKAVTLKRDVTISALFHGLVSSNVAFTSGMQREDAADFDTVLRHLLPIKYDKKSNGYMFDGKKAFASAEKLSINLEAMRTEYKADAADRDAVVEQFYTAVMSFYAANAAAKKAADLDNDAKKAKGIERIKSGIAQAKQNGATDRDIIDALLAVGIDVSGALTVLPVPEAA